MGRFIDLTGKKFNRLTVIKRVGSAQGGVYWLCKCDCGKMREALSSELNRSGKVRACLDCERASNISQHTKHGMSRTPLYKCWQQMMQRCYNPNNMSYPNYGAKGVSVYTPWHDVNNFLEWAKDRYQKGMSLDRISVMGDYFPFNCRFITRSENSKGLRRWQVENQKYTA